MPAPLRVLLIKDSGEETELLLRELRRGGYEPVWTRVETGVALEAALGDAPWDVILSDYALPRLNVLVALRIIRDTGHDLPVLVVADTIDEAHTVAALRAGAHDVISTRRLARLLPALERELREARERRSRHRVEWALKERETRYRHLVETSPDAIVLTDMAGTILLCNEQATRLYSRSGRHTLVGRSARSLLAPEEVERAAVSYRQLLAEGSVHDLEYTLLRADGSPFPAEISASIVFDAQGQPSSLVCVIRDISARKVLEAQFLQSQKMEAVGRLAGGIAHDFNNLLTVISGYAEMLLDDLPPDATARGDIVQIRDAAERATVLTRQLLAFTRRQLLAAQTVDLNELVRGMERLLRRLLGTDVELRTQLAELPCLVHADPGQLEQVLLNLAINARDAMPDGGQLTIATTLVESANAPELPVGRSLVLLTIDDTGHGMDEETQRRIFEPFFTTKEPGKGTGLGLWTVNEIVRQSGGTIVVTSRPHHGTCFRIYLPLATEPANSSQAAEPERPANQRATTILVAEPDAAVRALIHRILSRQGHTLLEAEQCTSAVAAAVDHREAVQLLVTDLALPGGGGARLAVQLRRQIPDLRVIYLSGFAEHTVEQRRVPTDGTLLRKPFTPEGLLQSVADVLAN
ncbi:MAG: hypothetical protein OHK0015_32230 [Chloroflexi bacterium OHK40]